MIRLWPKSLAGQMIALLLLALVASQVISLVIFLDERRIAVRAADRMQVLSRTVSLVRLLSEAPPGLAARAIETASGPRLGFWLADTPAIDPADPESRGHPLHGHLATLLDGIDARNVLVRVEDGGFGVFGWRRDRARFARFDDDRHDADDHDEDDDDGGWRDRWHDHERWHERWEHRRRGHPLSLTISVLLDDGRWLNAETLLPTPGPGWAWPLLLSMFAMALAITLIVVLSVRRITRPMRALTTAAESFGRGHGAAPLPEDGPDDVRRTIRAFNEMRARLERFVGDRTRMLAAIGHDLRTPITSLRLRAEFIEDPEIRERILETLDEMQQMIEATLAFAREDAAREDTRRVDLAALVQSLCDDLADAGHDVVFSGAAKMPYDCRLVALKRALRNLIENAVAYGHRARVALQEAEAELHIVIDDDGPGIPEHQAAQVFEPFVRLETSRSRETGGVGLGLAIARSIVRSHGGDITLENRAEGGLRAIIRLPMARTA